MKLNKEDAKGPSKKFKVESVDGASCSTTDTGIEFDVSLKLADHKTTVELDVHMFNSCFHLKPATQDRDILEVNLCRPHYQKYKNHETLQSCYICDKTRKDMGYTHIHDSRFNHFLE